MKSKLKNKSKDELIECPCLMTPFDDNNPLVILMTSITIGERYGTGVVVIGNLAHEVGKIEKNWDISSLIPLPHNQVIELSN